MKIRRILKYRIPLNPPLIQNGFEIRERRGYILVSASGAPGEFAPLSGFSPSREEDILRDLGTFVCCRNSGADLPEPELKTPEARFAAAMLRNPLNTFPEKPPVRSLFGKPAAIRAALPEFLDSIAKAPHGQTSSIKIKAGIFPVAEEISLIRELTAACEARKLRGRILINPDGNRSLSPENARIYINALGEYLGYFEDPADSLDDCLNLGIPVGLDMLWPEYAAKYGGGDLPAFLRKHRAVPVIKPALTPDFMELRELSPVLSSAFESPAGIGWIRRLAAFFDTESGTDTLKYFPVEARKTETFIRSFTEDLE